MANKIAIADSPAARRLRDDLAAKKLTLKGLAVDAEVSDQALRVIIMGGPPRTDAAARIARVVGFDFADWMPFREVSQ